MKIISLITKLFESFVKLFGSGKELYYINGAESLPPPLSQEEEERLVLSLDNEEARQTLIEHNLRLVAYIAKRFENTGANIEELISIGTYGLIKAVSSFKAGRGVRLATYASRCIENEILMFIRKTSSMRKDVSIDEPLSVDWDGNELLLSDVLGSDHDQMSREIEEIEEKGLLIDAVTKLNDREREIIEMRYGLNGREELTQKEVADILGISQSYISRLEKKIIERLKEELSLVI